MAFYNHQFCKEHTEKQNSFSFIFVNCNKKKVANMLKSLSIFYKQLQLILKCNLRCNNKN